MTTTDTGTAFCGACGRLVARFDLDTRRWVAVPSDGHQWPAIDHSTCKRKGKS
jgi:hypothetical protein